MRFSPCRAGNAPETGAGGRVGARTAPLLHGSVHARGHGRARREGEGDGRHLRCSAGVLQRMKTRWRGRALLRDARRPHLANGAPRSTDRLVDRSTRPFHRKPLTGGRRKFGGARKSFSRASSLSSPNGSQTAVVSARALRVTSRATEADVLRRTREPRRQRPRTAKPRIRALAVERRGTMQR